MVETVKLKPTEIILCHSVNKTKFPGCQELDQVLGLENHDLQKGEQEADRIL